MLYEPPDPEVQCCKDVWYVEQHCNSGVREGGFQVYLYLLIVGSKILPPVG